MEYGQSFGRDLVAGICAAAMMSMSSIAHAVPVNGLRDPAFRYIYGSYAPGGDCSREPRVTINSAGMTFRASGRDVKTTRLEYAASIFGVRYEGITLAFYPFVKSDNTLGPVLVYVNDEEKPGAIRISADAEPGRPLDPFHAAIAGTYKLCAGSGSGAAPPATPEPSPAAGTPLEWTNLPSLVGRYPGSYSKDNIDVFDRGAIAAILHGTLGEKMSVLKTNLATVGPLERQGNLYYIFGNAPHRGGEDQAYVLIDATKQAVQVGLWEKGKLTVYAPASGRLPEPANIRAMMVNSPGEMANPAPGSPWELLPVQGRSPVAYVEAAASPNITSLTLYCENGRPYMAMLLNKPAVGAGIIMTWNFAGRIVDIPVQRAKNDGTYWVGGITGTPLLQHLMTQKDMVYLRINGRHEGEASLTNAPAVLRETMRQCAKL